MRPNMLRVSTLTTEQRQTHPKNMGRFLSSMTVDEMLIAATMIAAPPSPATARPTISATKLGDTAAISDPSSKMPMAAR